MLKTDNQMLKQRIRELGKRKVRSFELSVDRKL